MESYSLSGNTMHHIPVSRSYVKRSTNSVRGRNALEGPNLDNDDDDDYDDLLMM
jgi:hypothetical protein